MLSVTGYRKGAHYVVCDSCGLRGYSDQMTKKWNGSIVHKSPRCFETRHPQDTIEAHADRQAVSVVRNPPDKYLDGTVATSTDKFVQYGAVKASDL